MPHATIELHETYPHEHIEDSEHETVAEEMARYGAHRNATQAGAGPVRLIRGCYYGQTLTFDQVQSAVERIRQRLNRRVSAVFSAGDSYGIGLSPQMALPAAHPLASMLRMAAPVPPTRLSAPPVAPRKIGLSAPPTSLSSLFGTKKTG